MNDKKISAADETKSMLLNQMRKLQAVDPRDEDAVRNAAVLAQSTANCAKVFNECQSVEAKLLLEKRETAKFLAAANAAKELAAGA